MSYVEGIGLHRNTRRDYQSDCWYSIGPYDGSKHIGWWDVRLSSDKQVEELSYRLEHACKCVGEKYLET